MKDITPKHLRCAIGTCPAVYDVTPEHLQCAITASCPSVSTIGDGQMLLIVGQQPSPELLAEIEGRVGPDEAAIVISREYFANIYGGEVLERGAIEALKHAAHDRECREAAEAALIEGHVNEIERLRRATIAECAKVVAGFDEGDGYARCDEIEMALRALLASAPRQIEEPVVSFMEIAGDTGSIERLREAYDLCGRGGNHLAGVLISRLGAGEGFPAYGSKHEDVLKKLGAGENYELWCCWDAGMRARDIVEASATTSIEEPQRGDTGSPVAEGQPDTSNRSFALIYKDREPKILPKPIIPEAGH
jgi:hypothetical protein